MIFPSLLEKEVDSKALGTLFHSSQFSVQEENLKLQICEADMTYRGFQDHHESLQVFLMWFIQPASFTHMDGPIPRTRNKDGALVFMTTPCVPRQKPYLVQVRC